MALYSFFTTVNVSDLQVDHNFLTDDIISELVPNIAEKKLKVIAVKHLGLQADYIKSLRDIPGGALERKFQILTEWKNLNPGNDIEVSVMLLNIKLFYVGVSIIYCQYLDTEIMAYN